MRVFVTGSGGFVGYWACRDLVAHGHEVIAAPGRDILDLTDRPAVERTVADQQPDAILHLAAVSNAFDAASDPARALAVNVGGTINVLESARRLPDPPAVLVAGSAEIYGWPEPSALPLSEDGPIAPRGTYALSKAAQEALAIEYRARHGLRIMVTRSFNHSGPGQREPLVLPSVARRVLDVSRGRATTIPVGDIDVSRDFLDVRDVATAYRSLLEYLAQGPRNDAASVVNVGSGMAVPLRRLTDHLCRLAGIDAVYAARSSLMRPGEPRVVMGDIGRLRSLIDWQPSYDVLAMVSDLWEGLVAAEGPTG